MPDLEAKPAQPLIKRFIPWALWGCLVPALSVFVVSVTVLLWVHFKTPKLEPPKFIKEAAPKVEERQRLLPADPKSASYDIDSTVSALYSMEQALAKAKSFEDLTKFIVQKDSDLVAPDVVNLKYRFFDIYRRLLQSQDDLKDMDSLYDAAGGALLDIASITDVKTFSLSRDQAQKVWSRRFESARLRRELKERLEKSQDELVDLMFNYMSVSSKYYAEWDKLCSARDRAYLAVYECKWDEAVSNAAAASGMAPHEKEAHMLLAMALLERGTETDIAAAKAAIGDYIKEHPADAPGFLLRGVMDLKALRYDQAIVDFDQAAAYFPKMQDEMNDRLGIYRRRTFLNKSMEGRVIVNMYRSFMSGSGYFSPDFQKARIYLAQGRTEEARAKIFDHFFRRRQQGEWDKVLSDFHYCNKFLGTDLFKIGSGKGDVNISIDSALFSNSVVLTLDNRSKIDMHNLTALLCVRFTDMFKGDYISFPVGETISVLKAGQTVKVGRKNISELTEDRFGSPKKFKDIIEYAAVLISDEVITWVEAKPASELYMDAEPLPPDAKSKRPGLADKTKQAIGKAIDKLDNELTTERPPDSPSK